MSTPRQDLNDLTAARGAEVVTPADGVSIPKTRAIYIGATGNLAVTMADGDEVTFVGIAEGVEHPLAVVEIKSTGTTASSILALY